MSTHSIPTTGIQGIRFRSRIEAQWAEMFTKLGWEWEYEPIDLNGYIPDFIIKFPYRHLLVEVKGETNMTNIQQYTDKIVKSGWEGEFLLVCSVLNDEDGLYLGLLGATDFGYSWKGYYLDHDEPNYPTVKNKDYAHLTICDDCKKYTLYCHNNGWFCRNCGSGNGNKSLVWNIIKKDHKLIEQSPTQECNNCKKYDKEYQQYMKIFKQWRHENNISVRCPCNKVYMMCRSCSPYTIPISPTTTNECSCSPTYYYYDNTEYDKIKQFWIESKNHTQWKGK